MTIPQTFHKRLDKFLFTRLAIANQRGEGGPGCGGQQVVQRLGCLQDFAFFTQSLITVIAWLLTFSWTLVYSCVCKTPRTLTIGINKTAQCNIRPDRMVVFVCDKKYCFESGLLFWLVCQTGPMLIIYLSLSKLCSLLTPRGTPWARPHSQPSIKINPKCVLSFLRWKH